LTAKDAKVGLQNVWGFPCESHTGAHFLSISSVIRRDTERGASSLDTPSVLKTLIFYGMLEGGESYIHYDQYV
jgi:hypothetical protein